MKKKYLIVELILVFLLCALPPILVSSPSEPKNGFSFASLIELLIALALYFQGRFIHRKEKPKKTFFSSAINLLKYSPLCLGFLMLVFAFLQVVALVFHLGEEEATSIVLSLDDVLSWLNLVFIFASGAFFEETVYRDFIPESLIFLSRKGRPFFEILSIVFFALAHRYLGFLSVINAALCAVIFRFFRLKSGSVFPIAFAHFVYNMTLAVFYVLI